MKEFITRIYKEFIKEDMDKEDTDKEGNKKGGRMKPQFRVLGGNTERIAS